MNLLLPFFFTLYPTICRMFSTLRKEPQESFSSDFSIINDLIV